MSEDINFLAELEKFKVNFNQLEKLLKEKCIGRNIKDADTMQYSDRCRELAKRDNLIKHYKDKLDELGRVRNFMFHERTENYSYPIYPSPDYNTLMEKIIHEIENPPMILDSGICIKRASILTKELNDNVYATMQEMQKNMYTHIPILENEVLFGVFSESALFDYSFIENQIVLDETNSFDSIKECLKIENHTMEEFPFVSRKTNIYDIEEVFQHYFKEGKRIGCIYVTENGKKREKILGMLTAWDVLGKDN